MSIGAAISLEWKNVLETPVLSENTVHCAHRREPLSMGSAPRRSDGLEAEPTSHLSVLESESVQETVPWVMKHGHADTLHRATHLATSEASGVFAGNLHQQRVLGVCQASPLPPTPWLSQNNPSCRKKLPPQPHHCTLGPCWLVPRVHSSAAP